MPPTAVCREKMTAGYAGRVTQRSGMQVPMNVGRGDGRRERAGEIDGRTALRRQRGEGSRWGREQPEQHILACADLR